MAPESRSHASQLRPCQQCHDKQDNNTANDYTPVLRYGVGVCLGITAFKYLQHTVRKVPVVGPRIAGVMPAMALGVVIQAFIVQPTYKAAQELRSGADVQRLVHGAGTSFQQMLGAAGIAATGAATTLQAAVVAAATVVEREMEHQKRISASVNVVDREVARFMYRIQPQHYDFQCLFEETKRKLQQQQEEERRRR